LTTLSQAHVVTLAVYLLGGEERPLDTEDVAIKAYELAPTRFAWRKYPGQINLELVRVYLSDAKKTSKGQLLTGSGRSGWSLTPAGLKWARSQAISIDGLDRKRHETRSGSADETRWRRERGRIIQTEAWCNWKASQPVSWQEAASVFRIDHYVEGQLLSLKINRLQNLFEADEEVRPFLEYAAEIAERKRSFDE
jgi:hypothetical protein